jgi:hypothetical protein
VINCAAFKSVSSEHYDYAPSSNGADDYRELVKEFLGRIKKINK